MQQPASLHEILFGFKLPPLDLPTAGNISHRNPHSYSSELQGKLVEMRELVQSNTVETAAKQKLNYRGNNEVKLQIGQKVLLNNPTKGKLNPCLNGPWIVKELKRLLNARIELNNKERIVHVNRLSKTTFET